MMMRLFQAQVANCLENGKALAGMIYPQVDRAVFSRK